MVNESSQVIRRLVDIEENVGKLYRLFGAMHPVDFEFWMQLATEEDRHAALLRYHGECIVQSSVLNERLFSSSVETIFTFNAKIEEILLSRVNQVPNRKDCFAIAMQIEESAGEIHFQDAMPVTEEAVAFEVLQTLYADDKDHASRIKAYVTRRIPYSRL